MATEKFQQIMSQVLAGLEGVYNLHDDIRVVGMTKEELTSRLEATIQRLSEHGLTLNYSKCIAMVQEMEFMGIKLTSEGLKIHESKVKAITAAKTPKNKQELRSWLGLSQFCARFVRNFAVITSPLWDLTKLDVEWEWKRIHQESFEEIKHSLTTCPVMAYWNQEAETRITTDASQVGIGAILEQKQPDNSYRPIYYASKEADKGRIEVFSV